VGFPLNWNKFLLGSTVLFVAIVMSCGGTVGKNNSGGVCDCTPEEAASTDYRHDAKHVPLPDMTPQEIDVNTILSWPVTSAFAFTAPRSGREDQLFHIAQAFLQLAQVIPGDCDLHLEISQTADRNAPRIIVETPVDAEYCSARQSISSALAQHGFTMNTTSGDLPEALPVSVLGLAFQDFEHNRGSNHVSTPWELHPAIVTLQ
jgi:hypothetical protein